MTWRLSALAWLAMALPSCEQLSDDERITATGGSGNSDEEGGDPPPTSDLCDPVQQSCPNGFKCGAFVEAEGDVRYQCVEDTAWHELYTPCDVPAANVNDGCPKGSACLPSSFSSSGGMCLPLCVNGEGCDAKTQCVATVGIGVSYCAPDCAPLSPTCPHPNLECLESTLGFVCRFESAATLNEAGEACGLNTEKLCGEGLVCLYMGLLLDCSSASCCAPICDPAAEPSDCDETTECIVLDAPGYPPDTGACHIPF